MNESSLTAPPDVDAQKDSMSSILELSNSSASPSFIVHSSDPAIARSSIVVRDDVIARAVAGLQSVMGHDRGLHILGGLAPIDHEHVGVAARQRLDPLLAQPCDGFIAVGGHFRAARNAA